MSGRLFAISDLHVSHRENLEVLEGLHPESAGDWLIVAGDVAETVDGVAAALRVLAARFETVIWVPGNHELWTTPRDPVTARGRTRYESLVRLCRGLGVLTPEDDFPVWRGRDGQVTIAPLFVLYDYSFLPPGADNPVRGLEIAKAAGVVCTDEYLLHPDPYDSRAQWCAARLAYTERRLSAIEGLTVLVNHFPLIRYPTRVLRYPEFAQWCGTVRTADWPVRFNAAAVVYGHLHIPRTIVQDGIPHYEVSLGYPREWQRRVIPRRWLREVLPQRDTA
ncbi:MAG: metallophosphoesterase family protein [Sciscionella sp.]